MFNIISNLFFPAPAGFIDGPLHAFGHFIGIKNNQSIHITRCAAGSLCKGSFIAQKAFLIGIQNGYQR